MEKYKILQKNCGKTLKSILDTMKKQIKRSEMVYFWYNKYIGVENIENE